MGEEEAQKSEVMFSLLNRVNFQFTCEVLVGAILVPMWLLYLPGSKPMNYHVAEEVTNSEAWFTV